MRKYLLSAAVISGTVLAAVGSPAWAANLAALLGPSGQCGTQGVCLVPDSNWDVNNFTSSYDAATDTVTGSGAFVAGTPATGSSSIYFTDPSGVVSEILETSYSSSGSAENMSFTWQSDDDGTLDLGPVPGGATTRPENGTTTDVTATLFGPSPGSPSNITVQAQTQAPIPEPASLALLGLGLTGLGLVRRKRRQQR